MYQFFLWELEPTQIFFTGDVSLSDVEEVFNRLVSLNDPRLNLSEYWGCTVFVEERSDGVGLTISGDNDYLFGRIKKVFFEN